MDITCGTDIIEIDRIKETIESLGENFLNRVYTEKEIEYCESKKMQKYQHYAARFASKEAILKAASKYLNDKYSVSWKDIEITNDESGRPSATLNNKVNENINQIDISLSHCKQYAVANAVIMWH